MTDTMKMKYYYYLYTVFIIYNLNKMSVTNLVNKLFGDLKIQNISYSYLCYFFFLNPRKLLSVSFTENQEAGLQF